MFYGRLTIRRVGGCLGGVVMIVMLTRMPHQRLSLDNRVAFMPMNNGPSPLKGEAGRKEKENEPATPHHRTILARVQVQRQVKCKWIALWTRLGIESPAELLLDGLFEHLVVHAVGFVEHVRRIAHHRRDADQEVRAEIH